MKVILSKLASSPNAKPSLVKKFLPDCELWNPSGTDDFEADGSSSSSMSQEVEELIESCLDHFANDDATVLAEAYHNQVKSERSLFILGQSLARSGKCEAAYHLLKNSAFNSAQCRFLFAKCAYTLNRLQESESKLRDDKSSDKLALHPVFNNTPSQPFAHSLLAKILGETNRAEVAQTQLVASIESNCMLWSSVKSLCENNVIEQFNIKELFPKSSASSTKSSIAKQKDLWTEKLKDCSNPKSKISTTPATTTNTSLPNAAARKRAPPPAPKKKSLSTHSSTTTAATGTQVAGSRYRRAAAASVTTQQPDAGRLGAHSGYILLKTMKIFPNTPIQRAEEQDVVVKQVRRAAGHPLSSVNTTNTTTTTITAVSPQQRGVENDPDVKKEEGVEEPMDLENAENEPFQRDSAKAGQAQSEDDKKDSIYCSTLDWMAHISEVQDHLSHFRCSEALNLLESNMSLQFAQLPLSLELRARIFFENGEYRRACEVFEDCRRMYPHRVEGMEIFSTALWQLQDQHRLSALSAELTTNSREEPETWCVAGNCFSLEKQHETAVECLERAIRLNSRFGYAYSLLGHELITLNDLNRASQAFMQGIVCSPNDYRAWYGLGLVYYKEEQLSLARIHLTKAVQINSSNVIVLCQLAVVEQAQGRCKEAMEYLERALGFSPNNVACRYHKARLLFDTGHYKESLDELMELKALSPDEAHVFYLLGRVHRKLGNQHMALLSYSWATEMDPRGEQAQKGLFDKE
uniref:Cell division cycle protein 27 homolog n=1 Tax=Ditylenchus dipsaci TaxID=166011 RepID=A0A915DYN7_9BILA